MSQCPFKNILDPDIYVGGGHHAIFAEVREQSDGLAYIEDPITGVPYWAVTKREVADYVCKHPLLFSSAAKTILPKEMPEEEVALSRLMLVNMDPPEHVKYRRIVRNAFTPKAVQGYEARFREVARETIDAIANTGECEFVTDVAAELPLIAILSLCGIPMEDKQQFFDWTNTMIFTEDEDMSGVDGVAASQAAAIEVYAYAAALAEKHKTEPLTDIVGALLDGTVNDEKLTADEFQLFFLMLIAAGNESTRSVIAHGMRLLIEHPEQLAKLVDDPTLIPYAVEEVLRYNPAFVQMRRTVMEDVEVQGQQLRAGDKMVLNWQAINHDPEIFENPAQFDVERFRNNPELANQHRAFGNGEHFCIGAHMSRLEMQVMFEEIIPRLKNPRFAAPVEYVRDYFVNSIKAMPLQFEPEAAARA
ncbi:cytochrome P450 [Halieaceae bacterium IMCC14734]|uniref:Cytochrome P450 n=1 Tax=Candidatus Litorirhabdus singularis TaxID=2518993 RepID=A0ABT3TKI5_9GAMM|nr:cytochrome P450 [Candidatus Litorirhabdus singularis]MCX2982824.1 cytochrome P450 [Candidatus Litorirhabdus singularis]